MIKISDLTWKQHLFVFVIAFLILIFLFNFLRMDNGMRSYYFAFDNDLKINQEKCYKICDKDFVLAENRQSYFKCTCIKDEEKFNKLMNKKKKESINQNVTITETLQRTQTGESVNIKNLEITE